MKGKGWDPGERETGIFRGGDDLEQGGGADVGDNKPEVTRRGLGPSGGSCKEGLWL